MIKALNLRLDLVISLAKPWACLDRVFLGIDDAGANEEHANHLLDIGAFPGKEQAENGQVFKQRNTAFGVGFTGVEVTADQKGAVLTDDGLGVDGALLTTGMLSTVSASW